jgi:hypothetical protein
MLGVRVDPESCQEKYPWVHCTASTNLDKQTMQYYCFCVFCSVCLAKKSTQLGIPRGYTQLGTFLGKVTTSANNAILTKRVILHCLFVQISASSAMYPRVLFLARFRVNANPARVQSSNSTVDLPQDDLGQKWW